MNEKKIRYTAHLLERIGRRKIGLDVIESIIENPQQKIPDKDDPEREIYQSVIVDSKGKQKIIRIIIQDINNEKVVITAYISSKVSKYWSQNEN